MSSIDQVIARSRQQGEFTERKRFTVARANAIRKMRQFALADPYFYVLELIQSAVANGASYIDVSVQKSDFVLSYVGGGYDRDELTQLFDFLFAAKSDMSYSDLRQLALGVNAMMLMEPAEIVIESGDGTLENTTRVVFQGGKDIVDLGTPESPLRGTFIRASKLKRSKIRSKSNLHPTDYGPEETRAIEERCLCAPVPILVNDRAPFGYSTLRTPSIYGYERVISIDEGDLYGTIGIRERGGHTPSFKILTYGTWIQTLQHNLLDGHRLGGIINFDGLNKTADHAAIVRDDRLGELWIRLLPYARQLLRGDVKAETHDIRTMDNTQLSISSLRDVLRGCQKILIAPLAATFGNVIGERAMRIGSALDATILRANAGDVDAIRYLAPPDAMIIQPNLDDADDLRFYEQPPLPDPPRPWIIGAIEVEEMTQCELVKELTYQDHTYTPYDILTTWCEKLGAHLIDTSDTTVAKGTFTSGKVTETERFILTKNTAALGTIKSTIFTPRHIVTHSDEMLVRVISSERLIWAGRLHSSFPGHVLQIEIDNILPGHVREAPGFDEDFGLLHAIASEVARRAQASFESATQRALEGVRQDDEIVGLGLAQMILAAIARDSILRLRSRSPDSDEMPGIEITMLEDYPLDLTKLSVFRTLGGELRSVRQVVEGMCERGGLVYGVIESIPADLDAIDTSEVLSLSLAEERLLMILLGPSSYVRLDARDILAEHNPSGARLRDIAVGIFDGYAEENPLLVEGAKLGAKTTRPTIIQHLLTQLTATWCDPSPEEEEQRRQALRHLQWYLVHALASPEDEPTYGLEERALFIDIPGRPCNFEDIYRFAAEHDGKLFMGDGRGVDATFMGDQRLGETRIDGLALNPFAMLLLERLFSVQPSFDFDLMGSEAKTRVGKEEETIFLSKLELDTAGLKGEVGIPKQHIEDPSVLLLSRDARHTTPLRGVARRFGLVGILRHVSDRPLPAQDTLEKILYNTAQRVLLQLLKQLPEMETGSADWERAVWALLHFCDQHYQLTLQPGGRVVFDIHSPLAERTLNLPLFDTSSNTPTSGVRILTELCASYDPKHPERPLSTRTAMSDKLAPPLTAWIEHARDPKHIVRLPDSHHRSARDTSHISHIVTSAIDAGHDPTFAAFEASLYHWLETLRPDRVPLHAIRVVQEDNLGHLENVAPSLRSTWTRLSKKSNPFHYVTLGQDFNVLLVDRKHWLIEKALTEFMQDSESLAWALLSAYAQINEVLEPVTNKHELDFQAALIKELSQNTLAAISSQAFREKIAARHQQITANG
jgi:hypothetical protein